ncbi:hypothetical protein KK137_13460 [Croceibacterium sp. LX-88]|uniref:Uncharacterized protein n=1 Tax=Croceibacterium selenioxidans TaxID=2838833 RepID=A0ABS5W6I1_9SPHN|nr:hypothetical protein [Croceibacterium selenioxidans]MBT2135340.1 hypothetical protein [Croceibacterium selenioxidans]
MNAMPPSFYAATDSFVPGQNDTLEASLRWTALAEAARVVATLARVETAPTFADGCEIGELLQAADPWRRDRAEHGITDISAFMQPGIVALLSVSARGVDPKPAAMALWEEFVDARAAVIALLKPGVAA